MEEIGKRIKAKYGPDESIHSETTNGLWVMLYAIQAANSLDTTVVKNKWETLGDIPDTIFGTAHMGGQETYGIRHVAATAVPLVRLMNGQMSFGKWVDVRSP
jgi:hypothetical protein